VKTDSPVASLPRIEGQKGARKAKDTFEVIL
jgi:hypothetical protein